MITSYYAWKESNSVRLVNLICLIHIKLKSTLNTSFILNSPSEKLPLLPWLSPRTSKFYLIMPYKITMRPFLIILSFSSRVITFVWILSLQLDSKPTEDRIHTWFIFMVFKKCWLNDEWMWEIIFKNSSIRLFIFVFQYTFTNAIYMFGCKNTWSSKSWQHTVQKHLRVSWISYFINLYVIIA